MVCNSHPTFPPRTRRDLEADAALLRELQRNEKVAFDEEGRLYYQPEIHVKSKEALLKKIQVSDKPVLLKSILEAYPRAARDLEVGLCARFLICMYALARGDRKNRCPCIPPPLCRSSRRRGVKRRRGS